MWKLGLAICSSLVVLACGGDGDDEVTETAPDAGSFVVVDLCKGVMLSVAADGISESALEESIETNAAFNGPPSWSPDGSRLAIAEGSGDHGLWVMNADGTEAVDLVNDDAGYAHWSPDGQHIAYTRFSEERGGVIVYEVRVIHVISADGTDDQRVAEGEFMGWSADGTSVIYTPSISSLDSSQPVLAMTIGGGEEPRKLLDVPANWTLAVSPDGSQIAYIASVGERRTLPGGVSADPLRSIFVLDTGDENGPREVVPPSELDTTTLSYSPSGDALAFVERGEDGNQYIEVVNADGGGRRRITGGIPYETEIGDFPLWSLDGTQIMAGGLVIPVDGSGEKTPNAPSGLALECPSELSVRPATVTR